MSSRHHEETELKTQRLKAAQLQADMRDRINRERVKGLEEQVTTSSLCSFVI